MMMSGLDEHFKQASSGNSIKNPKYKREQLKHKVLWYFMIFIPFIHRVEGCYNFVLSENVFNSMKKAFLMPLKKQLS